MNDLIFNVLKLVVTIVSALIAVYLIPYLENKLHDEKYAQLIDIIYIAVRAAEQTIGAGKGTVKKDEVITFVTEWMNERNIRISEEQLSQLIEAAVFEMKRG